MAEKLDPVTLELLQEIEQNRFESQRKFAAKLDIAVGLANSYIKRSIKKGWIKMSRAPARRYAYYLTSTGFREKSRLTAQYLRDSFKLYRRARREYQEAFSACRERGWHQLGLYGAGDLAEIAALSARESEEARLVLVEPGTQRIEFLGLKVAHKLAMVQALDAVLVTTIDGPQQAYETLREHLPPERIVTIPLLHVARDDTAE